MLTSAHELQDPLNILLVEDDAVDAISVNRALKRAQPPIRLTQVDRLQSALGTLRKTHPVDLVLLDLRLPDTRSHLEGIAQIKSLRPDLPVVVLSASSYETAGFQAMELGAAYYVPKSRVNEVNLAEIISKVVTRHRAQENLRQLVASSTDGIAIINARRQILFANEAAQRLLDVDMSNPQRPMFDYPITTHVIEMELTGGKIAEMQFDELEWDEHAALLVTLRDITWRFDAWQHPDRTGDRNACP